MTEVPYRLYRPRWYKRRVSTYWWAERWSYFLFILRELSSVFIAWLIVFLLLLVRAVSQGAARYDEFLAWATQPAVLAINGLSLAFVLLHAITWFNLAPKAMVVHVGRKRVPPALIAASNYGAWIVVSAGLAWLLLRS